MGAGKGGGRRIAGIDRLTAPAGTYTLTVTTTNPCGEAVGSFPVELSAEAMYRIYLPLVVRDSGQQREWILKPGPVCGLAQALSLMLASRVRIVVAVADEGRWAE